MSELFLLSVDQMRRIEPFFPLPHGIARVDDSRVVSGIVYVIRNGLQWKDAPLAYGPHKTLYNRYVRWAAKGVWVNLFHALARAGGPPAQVLIDSRGARLHGLLDEAHLLGGGPAPSPLNGRDDLDAR